MYAFTSLRNSEIMQRVSEVGNFSKSYPERRKTQKFVPTTTLLTENR